VGKAPAKAMEKAELVLGKDPENIEAIVLKGSVLLVQKESDKVG
jgi:hypothetical protein